MKVKFEPEEVIRRKENIDEIGFKLLISFNEGTYYSVGTMTKDELKQLAREIDYFLLENN